MTEVQQSVEAFEETQNAYYTTIKTTTQQVMTSIVNESMTLFAQEVEHMIQEQFVNMEWHLNQMVDKMLQDVSAAADDAQIQLQKISYLQLIMSRH